MSICAGRVGGYAELSRPPCVELRIGAAGGREYSGCGVEEDDVSSRNIFSPATMSAWRGLKAGFLDLSGEISHQARADRAGFVSAPQGVVGGAAMRTLLRTAWKLPPSSNSLKH